MGILSWILFGLIAGAIAKFILPGRDPGGIIVTILLGIVGGFLGGWIGSQVTGSGVTGFNLMSFVWAIVGAVILLGIYRMIFHRSHA
ncbi:GlsB/YeaQ/YmgE family stress response membrane protein [Saccharopolyspora sp. NPDC000359]|uniref:GlsB/YeaQ/YmgE family stress response membrane protein n=1 Tax=Saccharopolyspora sp. NPDC000359 TaxID=3154251 RepID=UPI0033191008